MSLSRFLVTTAILASALFFRCPGLLADGWGDLTGRIVAGKQSSPNDERQHYPELPGSVRIGVDGGLRNAIVCLPAHNGELPSLPVHPGYKLAERPIVKVVISRGEMSPGSIVCTSGSIIEFVSDEDRLLALAYTHGGKDYRSDESNLLQTGEAMRVPRHLVSAVDPNLSGAILVRDEPYFATTDEEGRFRIRNLPSGNWTFVIWHAKGGRMHFGGYLRDLRFADQEVEVDEIGQFQVQIEADKTTDIGEVRFELSELVEPGGTQHE